MSLTKFEEQDFKKPIPEEILDRVKENMETYNLDLSDALEEAAREMAAKDSLLWRAWYYNDYREFIPSNELLAKVSTKNSVKLPSFKQILNHNLQKHSWPWSVPWHS